MSNWILLIIVIVIVCVYLFVVFWPRKQPGKIVPHEKCRKSYFELRALFDSVVSDYDRFEMVYAYNEKVVPAFGGWTPTFKSYAVGFDATTNEVVILRVKANLSEHGELFRLPGEKVSSAKQKKSSKEIEIFIHAKGLPDSYLELQIPRRINVDANEEIMPVEQDREAGRFQKFFTNQFEKKEENEYW